MFASVTTVFAWLIVLVLVIGWIGYALFNSRQVRPEIGSELELAANRKPYYDDEVLEGRKIERTQLLGILFLIVITISLPLYWVLEPGRQAGARDMEARRFVGWGSALFAATADGGFNCAGCHGGMSANGGVAPFAVTDPTTGEVKSVNWKAPSLNAVFYRFSEDEVRFILEYGRPFSPMSAWGTVGGGPMNEQQIQTLIEYMRSIQLPEEDGHIPAEKQDALQKEAEALVAAGTYDSIGEALFNIEIDGGAYSCARCHTKGYSYGQPQVTGGGAFGPNLTGGSTIRQFPNKDDMIQFIEAGSEYGKRYGAQGQGSGRMPGFGTIYTDEQIAAIVEYVRGL